MRPDSDDPELSPTEQAYEQIYYSSLIPRTYLCTRLLEMLD
jgi:hypothetical protein